MASPQPTPPGGITEVADPVLDRQSFDKVVEEAQARLIKKQNKLKKQEDQEKLRRTALEAVFAQLMAHQVSGACPFETLVGGFPPADTFSIDVCCIRLRGRLNQLLSTTQLAYVPQAVATLLRQDCVKGLKTEATIAEYIPTLPEALALCVSIAKHDKEWITAVTEIAMASAPPEERVANVARSEELLAIQEMARSIRESSEASVTAAKISQDEKTRDNNAEWVKFRNWVSTQQEEFNAIQWSHTTTAELKAEVKFAINSNLKTLNTTKDPNVKMKILQKSHSLLQHAEALLSPNRTWKDWIRYKHHNGTLSDDVVLKQLNWLNVLTFSSVPKQFAFVTGDMMSKEETIIVPFDLKGDLCSGIFSAAPSLEPALFKVDHSGFVCDLLSSRDARAPTPEQNGSDEISNSDSDELDEDDEDDEMVDYGGGGVSTRARAAQQSEQQPPVVEPQHDVASQPAQSATQEQPARAIRALQDIPQAPRGVPLRAVEDMDVLGNKIPAHRIEKLLNPEGMLSTDCISAYTALIRHKLGDDTATFFIDPDYARRVFQRKALPHVGYGGITGTHHRYVTPVCIDNHWVVIVVERTAILILNSIAGHGNKAAYELAHILAKALDWKPRRTVFVKKFPQQSDGCSCGVFAAAGLFCLAFGVAFPASIDHLQWRRAIFHSFKQKQILVPRVPLAPHKPRETRLVSGFLLHATSSVPRRVDIPLDALQWRLKTTRHPAERGLSRATRDRHRRWLARIQQSALQSRPDQTWAEFLIEVLLHDQRTKRLQWTTVLTYMGAIEGALKRLDQYIIGSPNPILLSTSSLWSDFRRSAMAQKRAQERLGRPTLDPEHVPAVAAQLQPLDRLVFLLAWTHAARPGNVLLLQQRNLECRENLLTITWTAAKTVARRGPYTTAALINQEIRDLLPLVPQNAPLVSDRMAPQVLGRIRTAIRAVAGASFDLRSIRRGALTALAERGASIEDLMLLSGHTSQRTLLLYLGHGRHARNLIQRMAAMAHQP